MPEYADGGKLGCGSGLAEGFATPEKWNITAENGRVYVATLDVDFELLAKNELGENCLATPTISAGTLYFRTQGHLIAIREKSASRERL